MNRCLLQRYLIVPIALSFHVYAVYLNWTVSSNPALFGSTVTLQCHLIDSDLCFTDGIWKWTGGKAKNIISLNNFTSNSSKYSAKLETCSVFTLYIHNFAVEDVDQFYACEFDLLKKSKLLSLNEYPFEYHPRPSDIEMCKFISDEILFYNITLCKVYPKPDCHLFISKTNLTQKMESYVKKVTMFFQVQLKIELKLDPASCEGMLNIWCQVGQSRIRIDEKDLRNCTDVPNIEDIDQTANKVYMYLILLSVAVVLITFVTGLLSGCFIKRKYRLGLACLTRNNNEHPDIAVSEDIEEETEPLELSAL